MPPARSVSLACSRLTTMKRSRNSISWMQLRTLWAVMNHVHLTNPMKHGGGHLLVVCGHAPLASLAAVGVARHETLNYQRGIANLRHEWASRK